MTPTSVGAGESLLVLGKHSGRHAVESRLVALGCRLSPHEVDQLTAEVKDLADRKKFVYDDDLLALAGRAPAGSLRLVRYQAVTGNRVMPTATVEVERDGRAFAASAVGNGPLDAALKAADAALGLDVELLELHTRAVTAGKDALAEVSVRVRFDGREAQGQAASTDSIEAALTAYLSAAGAARVGQEAA
jgi:2-isopropylmalate synthase